MKNWKRFIAACLSVTMVASTPLTAFAEASVSVTNLVPKASKESTTETPDETDFEEILSQEKPYEYFSGLENQKEILDACKDEELYQLKEYLKYAYIHESALENRQSLDAYLLISEAWKNRNVSFKKEEQEQLQQFLEDTKVYGTKYKDGEKEKSVKDFPTYMEYLQSIKTFDVPRYVELLSAFDEAKTEDDLAKAMEAFSNFEEETYGFDEQEKEPVKEEDAENSKQESSKEDKKEESKAEQTSLEEIPKEESNKRQEPSKEASDSKKSTRKIVEFLDAKENGYQPLQCHIISKKEKDTMPELLPKEVKVKVETGDIVNMKVEWKVDEDPATTNNTVYTYDIQIPNDYAISNELQTLLDIERARLPFIYIKIKEELEKEGHQRPFLREPIYVEPQSDERAGTNAGGHEYDYEIYDITNDGSKVIIKGWAYTADANQYGKYQGQAGNSVAALKDYLLNQHPGNQWGGYYLEVRNASGGLVGTYPYVLTERVDHTELWKGDSRNPTLTDVAFRFDIPLSDLVNKGDLYLNLHYVHPKVGDASFYLMYLAPSTSMTSGAYRVDFKADNVSSFRTTGTQTYVNKDPWKGNGGVFYNGNRMYYETNNVFSLSNGTWVNGQRSLDDTRVTWFYTRGRYVGVTQSDGWKHRMRSDPNGTIYGWIPSTFLQYNCSNFRINVSYNNYTVTYHPNGGGGGNQYQSVTGNSNWTTYGWIFSRTGYHMTSYNTAADGSGTKFTPNYAQGAYWRDYNLDLYAQWTPNVAHITYNVQGGTVGNGYSTNQYGHVSKDGDVWFDSVTYGNSTDPYNASTFGLTKPGYRFVGWRVRSNGVTLDQDTSYGSTTYVDVDNANLNTSNTAEVWCYLDAVWEKNTYTNTIAHWAGGFRNNEGNNGNKDCFQIGTTSFNAQSGSSYVMNTDRAIAIPNGFYLGNTFGTPYISGSWGSYPMGTTVTQKNGPMSYEYYYQPYSYKISYNLNGGTNHSSNPSSYNVLYGISLQNPTKAGYTFAGWYNGSTKVTGINAGANATFSSPTDMYNKLASRQTGNITLTAKWVPNTYTNKIWHRMLGVKGDDGQSLLLGITNFTANYNSTYKMDASRATKIPNGYTLSNTFRYNNGGTYEDYTLGKTMTQKAKTMSYVYMYDAVDYKITYNLDGGTNNSGNPSKYNVLNGVTLKNPTKTGYTFTGWYLGDKKVAGINEGKNATFGNVDEMYAELAKRTTGDLTLTAKWTPNTYTIKYDGNGATGGSTASSTHTYNVAKALTANGFTKTGYTFKGWNTKADGSGTSYTNKQSVKNLTATNGATITLYAQWTPKQLVTTFHRNTSTTDTTTAKQTFIYDVAGQTFTDKRWTRTGYTLLGWADNQDAIKQQYAILSSVSNGWIDSHSPANDVYAVWSPNTYTIKYNGNGATGGSTANSIHTYDVTKPLTTNGFSKTGYTFVEWNTKADGSGTSYTNKQSVKNLTATNGVTITLYAQWAPNSYTVKYNGNGATGGSTASSTHVYNVAKALTANGFTKTGYTFKGWNTKADGSGTSYTNKQSVKNLTAINGATVTLYAQWTPNILTVRYHLNGGTDIADDPNFSAEDPARVVTYTYPNTTGKNGLYDITTARVTPPTGYLIEGHWNTKADGSGTSFNFTTEYTLAQLSKQIETGNAVVDLYAQWTPKKLVTTFHKNDGSTTTATQTFTYDVAGQKFSDKKWTRTGYTLLGWADSKTATKQQYAVLSGVSNAWIDKHYPANDVYAVWKVHNYTIQYDGNTATGGSTPNSSHTYDKPQTLTPNGFEKDGYYFDSWNTKPDGSGDSYQDKETVKNLSSKDGDTVTLYAQWKPVDYKIVYKGNGSTGGTEKTHLFNQKEVEANGYVLKTNKGYTDFVRTKHTFMGWYQNSVVNTKTDMAKIYKQGGKLTYSQLLAIHAEQVKKGLVKDTDPKVKNIILYAVWDEAPSLDISGMKKSQFHEGVDVTRAELLDGITANDKIDGNLTSQIIITRIDYSAGKLVNGKKQAAYSQTWANGMPADAKLDTWFMQLDKNDSPVTHTVTYQVKDSAGNITTAKKTIQVVYNEFPTIKANDFEYELKFAQAGKITKEELLDKAIASGIVSASDVEDGNMNSKIELIDYDSNAFKTMKQEGFIPITYRVQDSMGPGGKGKVTLKTVNVNIIIRQKEETVRYVRFINKEYYEKNANLDRNALAGKYDQIALLSVNGGLHPFSVWYMRPEYRNLITETFEKTTGTTYVYTKDDIKKMREFVKQHGVGNAKEEDALSKFADVFMTEDYILK